MWSSQPHFFLCVFLLFNVLYILTVSVRGHPSSVEILWFHIVTFLFWSCVYVASLTSGTLNMSNILAVHCQATYWCLLLCVRAVQNQHVTELVKNLIHGVILICVFVFQRLCLRSCCCVYSRLTRGALQSVSASWLWMFLRLVTCCGGDANVAFPL